MFKFEDRGGLILIDWIDYQVSSTDKTNDFLKRDNIHHSDGSTVPVIPVMYSHQALEAANEINLRKLAAIPYHEKYPPERIKNCVLKVWGMCTAIIFPEFENWVTNK